MRSLLVACLSLGLGAACGAPAPKAAGESCVASSECAQGLVCDFGQDPHVCAGTGTPRPDAGPPAPDADPTAIDGPPAPDSTPGSPDAQPIDAPPIDAPPLDAPPIDAPPIDAMPID